MSEMLKWLKLSKLRLLKEVKLYGRLVKDPRTPRPAKILLGLAVGYVLLPFDIIPDFIPIIGHLDDAVLVPLIVFLAFKMIPKEVIEDCKR